MRLAQRTGALRAAKINDADATTTIVELAARFSPTAPLVWDIGCGLGTTTVQFARRLAPARLTATARSTS